MRSRLDDRVAAWRVTVERIGETETSMIAFGRRGNLPVVVKVIKPGADEWRSGEILNAFRGRGAVRVYDMLDGAMLLERATPGESLATMTLNGADDEAMARLSEVIVAMAAGTSPRAPTARDWGAAFARYEARQDSRLQASLVSAAQRAYSDLCESQTHVGLLHGDLHHRNVLFDKRRGWLAIDPKGVIGEPEFEVGAMLRNPSERPELFADAATVGKRVARLARELGLDATRMLSWAFAQAVLSMIWSIEDGFEIAPGDGRMTLAHVIAPILFRECPWQVTPARNL
jgi:streptomycin 6-kinase